MQHIKNYLQRPAQTYPEKIRKSSKILSWGLAGILITLYAGITCELVRQAFGLPSVIEITQGVTAVYTAISGLVSALVVAVLAITPQGESPSASLIGDVDKIKVEWKDPSQIQSMDKAQSKALITEAQARIYERRDRELTILINVYIIVWLICGTAALVIGVLIRPNTISVLSDTGTAWFGVAIVAVYSYFGIKPNSTSSDNGEAGLTKPE